MSTVAKPPKPELHIDVNKITAAGPGLVNARTNLPANFTVYTHSYQESPVPIGTEDGLDCSIEGPSTPIPFVCQNNKQDGSVNVSWTPLLAGEYKIHVRFDGQSIKESPFKVKVRGESIKAYKLRIKVKVSGEGLKTGKVNQENKVEIDVGEKSIAGGLVVSMAGPKGAAVKLNLVPKDETLFDLTYLTNIDGDYLLYVKLGEDNIVGSPFPIKVTK